MKLVLRTFIFFLSAIALLAQQSEFVTSNDEVVLTIEHRLDGVAFSHRTKINLVKKADGKQTLVFPEKNGVFGEDVLALRRMLDTNSLYTIRIQSHYANVSSAPILSSIPVKSGFKEDITVNLDPKQRIIGVSYSTPTSTVSRDCDSSKVKDATLFQTRIKLGESVPIQWVPIKAVGARPAGMKDVKLGPEDATARPEKKSFLQQYWYVVLFMVIYMFLGRAEPEKAATGATAGSAPAAAPAAAK